MPPSSFQLPGQKAILVVTNGFVATVSKCWEALPGGDGSAWHQDAQHKQGPCEAGLRCSGWVIQRMMRSEDLPQKTVPKQRRREWLCHSVLGEPRVLPGGGSLKGQEEALRQAASTPSGPLGRLAVPRRHIKHETEDVLRGS